MQILHIKRLFLCRNVRVIILVLCYSIKRRNWRDDKYAIHPKITLMAYPVNSSMLGMQYYNKHSESDGCHRRCISGTAWTLCGSSECTRIPPRARPHIPFPQPSCNNCFMKSLEWNGNPNTLSTVN